MNLSNLILVLALSLIVDAIEVAGIFTKFLLERLHPKSEEESSLKFNAHLHWNITAGMLAPGDMFSIDMPGVSLVPGHPYFLMHSDDEFIATCEIVPIGSMGARVPRMRCMASKSITPKSSAHAKWKFEVIVEAGTSSSPSAFDDYHLSPGLIPDATKDVEERVLPIVPNEGNTLLAKIPSGDHNHREAKSMATVIASYTTEITTVLPGGITTQVFAVVTLGSINKGPTTTVTSFLPMGVDYRGVSDNTGALSKNETNPSIIHTFEHGLKSDLPPIDADTQLTAKKNISPELDYGANENIRHDAGQEVLVTSPVLSFKAQERGNKGVLDAESGTTDKDRTFIPMQQGNSENSRPLPAPGVHGVMLGVELAVGTTTIHDQKPSSIVQTQFTPSSLPPIALMTKVKVERGDAPLPPAQNRKASDLANKGIDTLIIATLGPSSKMGVPSSHPRASKSDQRGNPTIAIGDKDGLSKAVGNPRAPKFLGLDDPNVAKSLLSSSISSRSKSEKSNAAINRNPSNTPPPPVSAKPVEHIISPERDIVKHKSISVADNTNQKSVKSFDVLKQDPATNPDTMLLEPGKDPDAMKPKSASDRDPDKEGLDKGRDIAPNKIQGLETPVSIPPVISAKKTINYTPVSPVKFRGIEPLNEHSRAKEIFGTTPSVPPPSNGESKTPDDVSRVPGNRIDDPIAKFDDAKTTEISMPKMVVDPELASGHPLMMEIYPKVLPNGVQASEGVVIEPISRMGIHANQPSLVDAPEVRKLPQSINGEKSQDIEEPTLMAVPKVATSIDLKVGNRVSPSPIDRSVSSEPSKDSNLSPHMLEGDVGETQERKVSFMPEISHLNGKLDLSSPEKPRDVDKTNALERDGLNLDAEINKKTFSQVAKVPGEILKMQNPEVSSVKTSTSLDPNAVSGLKNAQLDHSMTALTPRPENAAHRSGKIPSLSHDAGVANLKMDLNVEDISPAANPITVVGNPDPQADQDVSIVKGNIDNPAWKQGRMGKPSGLNRSTNNTNTAVQLDAIRLSIILKPRLAFPPNLHGYSSGAQLTKPKLDGVTNANDPTTLDAIPLPNTSKLRPDIMSASKIGEMESKKRIPTIIKASINTTLQEGGKSGVGGEESTEENPEIVHAAKSLKLISNGSAKLPSVNNETQDNSEVGVEKTSKDVTPRPEWAGKHLNLSNICMTAPATIVKPYATVTTQPLSSTSLYDQGTMSLAEALTFNFKKGAESQRVRHPKSKVTAADQTSLSVKTDALHPHDVGKKEGGIAVIDHNSMPLERSRSIIEASVVASCIQCATSTSDYTRPTKSSFIAANIPNCGHSHVDECRQSKLSTKKTDKLFVGSLAIPKIELGAASVVDGAKETEREVEIARPKGLSSALRPDQRVSEDTSKSISLPIDYKKPTVTNLFTDVDTPLIALNLKETRRKSDDSPVSTSSRSITQNNLSSPPTTRLLDEYEGSGCSIGAGLKVYWMVILLLLSTF